MRVVGLTGGIATGKSTVAAMLRRLGATVIDADEATRAVQARGTEGLQRLAQEFGPGIITPDGDLDRARLAEIAFNDPDARRRLNGIVHPLVRQWMAERQQEAAERGDQVVVLDIPLLFDLRGMTAQQARARIAAQMPIEEKRRLATRVIENTGTMARLQAQVERVWAEIAGPS